MGMHLAHTISIIKNKSKNFVLRPDLAPSNLLFFQCLLQKVGVAPSWPCYALFLLFPNSWDPKLSADVSFFSVLATVLSEYWKKLEKIFFWTEITLRRLWKLCHFEKKSQAFFNILTEPLLVQKQTIHQQKAWDLSYLELKGKGRGMVSRMPRLLAAKRHWKKK